MLHSWNSITFYVLFYFIQLHFACSMASYWIEPHILPNCVFLEIQSHLLEKVIRTSQSVSYPRFSCIWLNLFQDKSTLCVSRTSIASYRNYPKTVLKLCLSRISNASFRISSQNFSYYVLAKNRLHLIKFTLRVFKAVFKP